MQDLVVLAALGLASARGTQLIVHDSILDPVRDRIESWRVSKFESKARKFVWDLLSCILCTGWWVSVITLTAYLTAAGQWGEASWLIHGIEAFVVAGIQVTLNLLWDKD